jgi:hypothetical protein
VKHCIDAAHGSIDGTGIADVALNDFDIVLVQKRFVPIIRPAASRQVSAQRTNTIASAEQVPHDLAAQTTAGAGDEREQGSPQLFCGPAGQLLTIDFYIVPHIHRQRFTDQNLIDLFRMTGRLAQLAKFAEKPLSLFSTARHSLRPWLDNNRRAASSRLPDTDQRRTKDVGVSIEDRLAGNREQCLLAAAPLSFDDHPLRHTSTKPKSILIVQISNIPHPMPKTDVGCLESTEGSPQLTGVTVINFRLGVCLNSRHILRRHHRPAHNQFSDLTAR